MSKADDLWKPALGGGGEPVDMNGKACFHSLAMMIGSVVFLLRCLVLTFVDKRDRGAGEQAQWQGA